MNEKKRWRWSRLFYVHHFDSFWWNLGANIGRYLSFYAIVCGLLWYFEPNLLFPRWAIPDHENVVVQKRWVEFRLEEPEVGEIHGIVFVPTYNEDWTAARGTMVYFHGNAETVSTTSREMLRICNEHDVNVIVFDYPGYGQSTGSPSEQTLLRSGEMVLDWWQEFSKSKSTNLVFLARSIGGGAAVPLATKYQPKGLILERTFDTAISPASNRYWFIPVKWIMTNRFRSIDHAAKYHGPVLQSHGDEDKIIPIEFGKNLYKEFPNKWKFVEMLGVGHNGGDTAFYQSKFAKFLDTVFREPHIQ